MRSRDELVRDMGDVIDGTATTEQAGRLEQALSSDPQARALFSEMKELDALLRTTGFEQPPETLKSGVRAAVATLRRQEPAPESWLETFKSAFLRRPILGYACTFSTGLGVGVLLLLLLTRNGSTPELRRHERTSATMMNHPVDGGNQSATVLLKDRSVTLTMPPGGADGEVRLRVEGNGLVDITLHGVSPKDSVIRLEAETGGEVRQKELKWNPGEGN